MKKPDNSYGLLLYLNRVNANTRLNAVDATQPTLEFVFACSSAASELLR